MRKSTNNNSKIPTRRSHLRRLRGTGREGVSVSALKRTTQLCHNPPAKQARLGKTLGSVGYLASDSTLVIRRYLGDAWPVFDRIAEFSKFQKWPVLAWLRSFPESGGFTEGDHTAILYPNLTTHLFLHSSFPYEKFSVILPMTVCVLQRFFWDYLAASGVRVVMVGPCRTSRFFPPTTAAFTYRMPPSVCSP